MWLLLLEAMNVLEEGREGARGDRSSAKRERLDWSRSSAESRSESEEGRCAQAEGPGARGLRGAAGLPAPRERTGGVVEALFGGKVRATVPDDTVPYALASSFLALALRVVASLFDKRG